MTAAVPPKTRQALKEKTSNVTLPVYEDAEHLIKDAKPKRGRPKKVQQNSDELMMGGGLGQRDDATAKPTSQAEARSKPKRGRPKKIQDVEDEVVVSSGRKQKDSAAAPPTSEVAMTTDELAKSDEAPAPIAKANRRPPRMTRKIVHNEAQNKVLEGLKQRMETTARGQKGKHTEAPPTPQAAQPSSDALVVKPNDAIAERTELSLTPSPPRPGALSVAKRPRSSIAQPGSVLRAQATPMIESSLLALKNFKRRPRQLSMLQMVKQRTASAAPSVAHTAIESTAVADSSVFDLELSDGDEEDFAPEAEGTPFARAKQTPSASARGTASTKSKTAITKPAKSSRKRKSDDMDNSLASVKVKPTKKRKSQKDDKESEGDVAAPVTHVPATQTSTVDGDTPPALETSDVQVQSSFSTSTPPTEPPSPGDEPVDRDGELLVPSTQEELADDGIANEDNAVNGTMAEPFSSSPPPVGRTIDDILADPLTQVSPPAKKTQSKPKTRTKPMLTATLQSLLPKRRQPLKPRRRKSEYDMQSDSEEDDTALDASHLDNDEDELGGGLRRQARTTKKTTTSKRGRPSKAATSTSRKASKAPNRTASAAPNKKKGPKTYGRQSAASDKENDNEYQSPDEGEDEEGDFTLPEVSISMEEAATSKEIEEAKKKFAEVDEWDFEFESMSAGNHRSSSPGWR